MPPSEMSPPAAMSTTLNVLSVTAAAPIRNSARPPIRKPTMARQPARQESLGAEGSMAQACSLPQWAHLPSSPRISSELTL